MTASEPKTAKPLDGWRVLVPRGGPWGDSVAASLRAQGAVPVVAPLINFAPTADQGALDAASFEVGTAYLLCPEATTRPLHRAALQSPQAAVTAVTNVFTGRPARGIVNRAMRELGIVSAAAPAFPLATARMTALRTQAEGQGSSDFTPLWSGQNASGCRAVPAADLTRALARQIVA